MDETNQASQESLITFPCEFPIKVMGLYSSGFEQEILALAQQYAPNLSAMSLKSRPSKTGKYLSVTVLLQAESQAQLDDIYRAFSSHEAVKMVL